VRTNIELDDELVAEAMAMTGLPTKRVTVEEALRVLLQHRRKTALANLACLGWEGDLDAMRECRAMISPNDRGGSLISAICKFPRFSKSCDARPTVRAARVYSGAGARSCGQAAPRAWP